MVESCQYEPDADLTTQSLFAVIRESFDDLQLTTEIVAYSDSLDIRYVLASEEDFQLPSLDQPQHFSVNVRALLA